MLKKKCFAALSGILLAITMIAPFSFVNVKAESTQPMLFYTYKKEVEGSTTYMVTDYYFMSNTYITTNLKMIWNNAFRITGNGEESSYIVEGDGIINYTRAISSSGSSPVAYKYTWEITLKNFHYFHFQVRSPASLWNSTDPSRYSWYVNNQFTYGNNANIDNSSYANSGVQANDYSIYLMLKEIRDNLSSGGSGNVDLTTIESLMEDIIDNQEIIIDKLDDILLAISSNNNQGVSDVIDNNDDMNEQATDVISDYDSLTSTFDSDFQDSQEDMTTILQNTSLTAFTDATVWFTTQLGLLYQSLGDMQILVAMPLILGIALFFIGRGNVVFKDPNTSTEQYSRIETRFPNGEKYNYTTITHTRTSRKRYD